MPISLILRRPLEAVVSKDEALAQPDPKRSYAIALPPLVVSGLAAYSFLSTFQNIGVAGPSITPVSDLRHALGAWNWPSGT